MDVTQYGLQVTVYTFEYSKCRLETLFWLNNTIVKPKLITNQLLKL